VISIGEREVESEAYPVKILATGDETVVPAADLVDRIRAVVRGE